MGIKFKVVNEIGVITITNAARRNALSYSVVSAIIDVFRSVDKRRARGFVVTGEGDFFSAGADLKEAIDSTWTNHAHSAGPSHPSPWDLFEAIESEPRIVVSAVNGPALGGGVELALACDIAVASTEASFRLPELGLGALPAFAVARLPSLVGRRRAKEIILLQRRIDAEEALSLGLVNAVHEPDLMLMKAIDLAQHIVQSPPAIIGLIKNRLSDQKPWSEIRGWMEQQDDREGREGVSAFVAKRRPDFTKFWNDGV